MCRDVTNTFFSVRASVCVHPGFDHHTSLKGELSFVEVGMRYKWAPQYKISGSGSNSLYCTLKGIPGHNQLTIRSHVIISFHTLQILYSVFVQEFIIFSMFLNELRTHLKLPGAACHFFSLSTVQQSMFAVYNVSHLRIAVHQLVEGEKNKTVYLLLISYSGPCVPTQPQFKKTELPIYNNGNYDCLPSQDIIIFFFFIIIIINKMYMAAFRKTQSCFTSVIPEQELRCVPARPQTLLVLPLQYQPLSHPACLFDTVYSAAASCLMCCCLLTRLVVLELLQIMIDRTRIQSADREACLNCM